MNAASKSLIGLVGLAAGLMVTLAACDATSPFVRPTATPIPTPTLAPHVVDFLSIEPASVTLEVGQTQEFTVTSLDGFEKPAWYQVIFVFDVAEGVGEIRQSATRTITSDNALPSAIFTATRPGTSIIRVTTRHQSPVRGATATVTVVPAPTPTPSPTPTPGPLDHVTLKPAGVTLPVTGAFQFTAVARDRFENPIGGLSYRFGSDDEAGQVDSQGNFVAGTRAGFYAEAVTVEVTVGGVTRRATADVTVTPGPPGQVMITPDSVAVFSGLDQRFVVVATDQFGNTIPTPHPTVAWSVEHGAGRIYASGWFIAGPDAGTYPDTVAATVTVGGVSLSATASVVVELPARSSASAVSTNLNTIVNGSTCAVTTAGAVMCWGSNSHRQFGDATVRASFAPVAVGGLTSGVAAVSAGHDHICALTSQGGVKCWGANRVGQLGDGTRTDRTAPVDVIGLTSGVAAIAAGAFHTCALTRSGGVRCWGWNLGAGQVSAMGVPTATDSDVPVDVIGLTSGVVAIAAGHAHTCAVTTVGGLKCWGNNYSGALGDGTRVRRSTPADVFGLTSGVAAVSAGESHTCALTQSGGVKCWGQNTYGQLGDRYAEGTNTSSIAVTTPVDVAGLTSGVAAVSAGGLHTCALTTAGAVKCWGWNDLGQLGDGAMDDMFAGFTAGGDSGFAIQFHPPVDVAGLTSGVAAISAGGLHTCAVTTSGGLKCWGSNHVGQLGAATPTLRFTPVEVVGFPGGVDVPDAATAAEPPG